MSRLTAIECLDLAKNSLPHYDAFLATVGYESRATYASQLLNLSATRREACAFAERQVGAFLENRNWFVNSGFDIHVFGESDVEPWTSAFIAKLIANSANSKEVTLCVDISSMSRIRLASLLAEFLKLHVSKRLSIDFVYSIATWSPPSEEPEPIVSAGAVLPFFAGWSSRPDLPTVALIGLGYEPDKAVGAYEYLEAAGVWAFVPLSDEARYTSDVDRANKSLLRRIPANRKLTYRVDQPVACFSLVESVVYGLLSQARPVLLPFGPKIFALCAMLVSCLHRTVPVWRISSGQHGDPVERAASGKVVGLRAFFESFEDAADTAMQDEKMSDAGFNDVHGVRPV